MDCKESILGRFNIFTWLGMVKHRGATHSLFATVLVTSIFWIISNFNVEIAVGVGYGYMMHLLGDRATRMGLPCWRWYPFDKEINKRINKWLDIKIAEIDRMDNGDEEDIQKYMKQDLKENKW